MEDQKDMLIKLLQGQVMKGCDLLQQQRVIIDKQRLELAGHRELQFYIAKGPWRFACWLMFNNIWPLSIWHHRFD